MLIRELKEVIKDLPDDADVIMQKRTRGKFRIFASIFEYGLGTIKDEEGKSHKRLILINDKTLKEEENEE